MPKTVFNALSIKNPEIMLSISRIIASRSVENEKTFISPTGNTNINLKTVAILPLSREVPIMDFSLKLKDAISDIGESCILLNSEKIIEVLGRHAFSQMGRLKLINWLADQEEAFRIVLNVADSGVTSPWSQRCIRQVFIKLSRRIVFYW